LPPETAHHVTLQWLTLSTQLGLWKKKPCLQPPIEVMGLTFPNYVGLGAGLDKNGDYIDALSVLGFGFIEVGTVTPRPQLGNPKPRLFRLVSEEAIINRMGFNNKGVDYLVTRLKKMHYKGILGINIGKNKDTTTDDATKDYLYCFKKVAPYASYITINISSPNTEKLRELQHGELLQHLLSALKQAQQNFFISHQKYVPLVVKVSPDLTLDEMKAMAQIFMNEKIDGIIATNTTVDRSQVSSQTSGGLSGKPLMQRSTNVLKTFHQYLEGKIPLIGCGGIQNGHDAKAKLAAGASLLQIYTGLIYQGPDLIQTILAEN